MKKYLAILALSIAAVGAQAQTIVYDNTTNILGNLWGQVAGGATSGPEGGDEITLAGTDRDVTSIDIMIHVLGANAGTADTQVRFYANDGAGDIPSTMLWDSGLLAAMPHAAGLSMMTFAVPSVTVPDTFTWTIEFTNRAGSIADAMGPRMYDPPTVGSSDNDFWIHNADTTWSNVWFGGTPVANFGSTVTAVPEPASMMAIGVGLAALLARRRRKKV